MFEHHKRTLDNLVNHLRPDPSILAIITGGSVAQGKAKETSDIDVYLLIDDESFFERKKTQNLTYINQDKNICAYEGGYIDGKFINRQFLELAAERGNEPTRASFIGSRAWFSRIPDLDALLAKIPVYPEANRDRNIKDFFAQVFLYGFYFSDEAVKKNDSYLLAHTASNLVLFGGRIILAHNRILYPYHKWLLNAVEVAPEKPDNFIEMANDLLKHPTATKCKSFAAMLLNFRDPGFAPELSPALFLENSEWNWLDHEPPLSDR